MILKETPYLTVRTHYGELCFFRLDRVRRDVLGVHCRINQWTRSVLVDCRRVWEDALAFLAGAGFKELIAVVYSRNITKTRRHFFEMFGMCVKKTTQEYIVFYRELQHG